MAESETADSPTSSPSLKPIVLPSRPTCTKCIAWSDELIAVAGGEVVHIIDLQSPQPRVEAVRVNEFKDADIRVDMSSQALFSLGREQSNSFIVSLAWSSPGLGIHRRPILAILTSNHLLSFWEHTGQIGTWRRTTILNPVLIARNADSSRRAGHLINSFAFLPPLSSKNIRAKDHFVAILDDEDYIWVVKAAKADATSDSEWKIDPLLQQILVPSREVTEYMSINIPISFRPCNFDVMELGSSKCFYDEQGSMTLARNRLHFRKTGHRLDPSGIVSFMVIIESENGEYTVSGHDAGFVPPTPEEFTPEAFTDVIADSASRFDKEYNLQGHYAVRWLGFAKSPDETMLAACITLHPSAGPEYTQPRTEQSTVLFVPTGKEQAESTLNSTQENVRLRILRSIARLSTNHETENGVDKMIIRNAIAAIRSFFCEDLPLMRWAKIASDAYGLADDRLPVEACEICHTLERGTISFAEGLDGGLCNAGHRFIRCGITLLSIQEPGISKYCTKCSKSFLRVEKLVPQAGSSLVKSLLEEWDLCPYCQGYFRD